MSSPWPPKPTTDFIPASAAQTLSSSIAMDPQDVFQPYHQIQRQSQTQYDSPQPQIMLVLVGLPGSGKTTFAEALVASTETFGQDQGHGYGDDHDQLSADDPMRRWVRASQDDAQSRRRQECEARVRWALGEGCNVIVDRVGFDPIQRSHFISIADSMTPRPLVYCLTLSVSHPTLESRLFSRTSHPTIPDAETGLRVLRQMESQFQPPSSLPGQGEGFDRVYTLREAEQPIDGIWEETTLKSVLKNIEERGEVEIGDRRTIAKPTPASGSRGASSYHNRTSDRGRERGGYRGEYGREGAGEDKDKAEVEAEVVEILSVAMGIATETTAETAIDLNVAEKYTITEDQCWTRPYLLTRPFEIEVEVEVEDDGEGLGFGVTEKVGLLRARVRREGHRSSCGLAIKPSKPKRQRR
ncbi:hypothetical protein IAT40_003221 [Kwoniella sp. CBS 6097]